MRVLVLGSDRLLFNPQSEVAKRQIAYGLKFSELNIIVFSLRREKHSPRMLSPDVHVYPTASASRFLYGLDAFRIARRLAPPDVISVQDPFEAGLIGVFLARMLKIPLHVQVHTDFLGSEFASHGILNKLRVRIAGFVLGKARRIRVVSERIRKSLERYQLTAPITILPIFVDVERFKTAHAGDLVHEFVQFRKRLLVVSRLEPEKNVRLAIDSFANVAPDGACLIIVGDGSSRRALEKRAARLGVADYVFFVGAQDPLPYYALADLVLVPSKYEGYGMTIVEALAAGKPVLATDVGVAREAGAIVASPERFAGMLADWFEQGMRVGKLLHYPYQNFDEYVSAYTADILACGEEAARSAASTDVVRS
ncbi:hypothetical protein A3A38_00370 [Candidatus Kaiserbacteria bacterium RIFCSPLOWO2_01_FULL_53_17]|uniref:Glycosyltransferase subfamily 4-like N-terminal domain-containing protein n=1 Tax=Candidatus Kaiserbacteria bacterium RIFCSPLOWO2_01_FULL_53_17 TaxID=1798511 RepID=A0A1F6EGA3_9BACT|nr:MAG: hypothetical protein A3A38_00370 [Candidatus Kaiserbacteria bacterium RIFCSPLOWO2_01_FULL_53_17]